MRLNEFGKKAKWGPIGTYEARTSIRRSEALRDAPVFGLPLEVAEPATCISLDAIAIAILKSATTKETEGKTSEKRDAQLRNVATLLFAICASMAAAATRVHLSCATNKVVVIDKSTGSTSSSTKENLDFWIDEASKSVSLASGLPLSTQRFDDHWISATGGSVSYEFDRESRNLTFAGTIMASGTATIIIGTGRCTVESDAR